MRNTHGGRPTADGPLRVVLAGGGTGGHLYPGLAVAERLRDLGAEVLFVGTRKGLGARVVPERGFRIRFVRARGFAGGIPGRIRAILEVGIGFLQSLFLLARERPHLVVGTGGYVCAPVVLAAALRGTPSVLMEQNALPGKATRFLARLARRVCVSFPGVHPGLPADRVVVTGNPVRDEIVTRERQEARRALGIPEGRTCVLVTGASQGAASLNRAVLRALPAWRARTWTVLHLTGPAHLEEVQVRSGAEAGSLDYRPLGYLEDMAGAYAAADVVVCRAGATTLAEVTARGLPAVLVPYPHAAERHQDQNAAVLVDHGAAVLLDDAVVERDLGALLESLLEAPERLEAMARASRGLGQVEAASRVVRVVLEETGRAGLEEESGTRSREGEERGR